MQAHLEPIVRKILLIVIINYSLTKTTINIMDCLALSIWMETELTWGLWTGGRDCHAPGSWQLWCLGLS